MNRKPSQGGFALIAAIWTLALLSMLVLSFTLDAYLEGKVSTFLRARHQASALIDSGLAIVEMLMERQDDVTGDETDEDVGKDRWIVPAIHLKRGERVEVQQRLLYDEEGKLQFATDKVEAGSGDADGLITIVIEPEPARWNINKLTQETFGDNADEIWSLILTQAGVPEEDQPEMVDSFYDWVDTDSTTVSSSGAESDYYEALKPPYTAKNGALDTVGELVYIRGFSRNNGVILRGGVWNPEDPEDRQITVSGIEPLFTTYGTGKINVNAAPRNVLMTVPALEDVDGLIVDTVIEEREGLGQTTGSTSSTSGSTKSSGLTSGSSTGGTLAAPAVEDYHFKDVSDLVGRVPGIASGEATTYLSVDSGVFRIEITGALGRITRKITGVVERKESTGTGSATTGLSSGSLMIVKWTEER